MNLPPGATRQLLPHKDAKLILGIRPEQLDRASEGESEDYGELAAAVEVVESMGSEQYVCGNVGGKGFVSRLDPSVQVKMGEAIRLAFPGGGCSSSTRIQRGTS